MLQPDQGASSANGNSALNHLAEVAQRLASTHQVSIKARRLTPLPTDFAAIFRLLASIHSHFRKEAEASLAVSHAAEWFLDNYYVIQQAQRQIKQDLPSTYYEELPKLGGDDSLAGYPRIYGVALAILWLAEYQLDEQHVVHFVRAYQTVQPLDTSELWALPIMLRLVSLQTIVLTACRLSNHIADDNWPDSMAAFQAAAAQGSHAPSDEDEAAIAHAILSLRLFDNLDWAEWFEQVSLVHRVLCQDPAGVYAYMDRATRDQYRRIIELIHRRSQASEVEIAEAAFSLAATQASVMPASSSTGGANGRPSAAIDASAEDAANSYPGLHLDSLRAAHVGYYLIGDGRPLLDQRLQFQPGLPERITRWVLDHSTVIYLSSVGVVALAVIGVASAYVLTTGGPLAIAAVWLLLLVPALTAGVGFTNWTITHALPPRTLPKLDFQHGVPAPCRTALVVPTLIANTDDIDHLCDELEQHYLRNPDPQLVYVLLTDFTDADQAVEAEDEALLTHAQVSLQALNDKVAHAPFYLLHRRRLWNPSQQKWMGWERKRGKLQEFTRLLRGATDTSFAWQFGTLKQLGDIRYVITLDADTVLPRGGAAALIGTLSHPLNRAVFDRSTGKVVAGYTILQPRTQIKPANAGRSLFTRVFAGARSLDLYTLAVSDAYQDFFGAGIFVGKGIFDVDAFAESLADRAPDNALLSHDLFEGIHGRAGLVTDIAVYEDFPSHYLLSVQRAHRWIRGDWQLLPWLFPHVPRVAGTKPNDLTLIDRWKIFDNLRRSLFAPASLLMFVASWTILPGSPLVWTGLSLLMPVLSVAGSMIASVQQAAANWRSWRNVLWALRDDTLRWAMFLAFLPYEAQLNLDAIIRTLVRTFITKRNMLEWTSAAQAACIHGKSDSRQAARKMFPTIILAGFIALPILIIDPTVLFIAAPFLVTWILAPQLADWISRPTPQDVPRPTPQDERQLRTLARRTWLFYEHFVGPQDNWLPPDNFQEFPRHIVAHRTSPTNIGLYLLSTLAAWDFGYVRLASFVLRLKFAFDTLDKLERYRGHFLNWIDTENLQPLPPPYVSTVDSGNLAAALIIIQQGCTELRQQPVWHPNRWEGLRDTVAVVTDMILALPHTGDRPGDSVRALHGCLSRMETLAETVLREPSSSASILAKLLGPQQEELNRYLVEVVAGEESRIDAQTLRMIRLYIAGILQHLEAIQNEQQEAMPWLSLLATPPEILSAGDSPTALVQAWQRVRESIPTNPRWDEVGAALEEAKQQLGRLRSLLVESETTSERTDMGAMTNTLDWCDILAKAFEAGERRAESMLNDLSQLAERAHGFVEAMDFSFLYDPDRAFFHIGYNINTGELDNSYYDLLASEARIASLLAIGKNDVPVKHWLRLGRPVSQFPNGAQALMSWSGTMFEYLMPSLLMRTYQETVFHQTYASVIDRQIEYGREQNTPWGISESGFYSFDAAMGYQYRAFGVPGLGLRRGLGDDLVVAPYASMLALPFRPLIVMENLQRFDQMKMIGRYGLYEAVDYTSERLSSGQDYAIVQSYMAHHQAMIFLGIANYLLQQRMIERFHVAPIIRSVDLLLQEQIPNDLPIELPHGPEVVATEDDLPMEDVGAWHVAVDTPMPLAHYLSNGNLSTLITNAGAGFCTSAKVRLTRWRPDTTLDDWGYWVYVQDLESGDLWSAGRQPSAQKGSYEEVAFHPYMAEFRRRTGSTSLHMEVFVVPDVDVEVRRITLTNDSEVSSRLGLVSYSEVALSAPGADRRHQAFTKLFIESEYHPEIPALLFRRRPRSADEEAAFVLHMLVRGPVPAPETAGAWGAMGFSADRAQFIGRTGSQQTPEALAKGCWWTPEWKGNAGATLDPIMALGQEMRLASHTSGQLAFVTLQTDTEEKALELAQRYSTWTAIERAQVRAQNYARREMSQLGFNSDLFQQALQLLSLCLYPHAACRADAATLAANTLGQQGLWAFGISGDFPILLVGLHEENHTSLLQELLQIHTYWRRRGLMVDLVIVNNHDTAYDQGLQNEILRVIHRMANETWLNQQGGIFVLRRDQIGEAAAVLLETVARVVLDGQRGSLGQHLADLYRQPASLPNFYPISTQEHLQALQQADQGWLTRPHGLQFDNGLGGFTAEGKEYVIYLQPGETTPAPWINVIGRPDFGFIASESGIGMSWALNSSENRLTTWRNDPLTDSPAEIIYLRDEETAEVWSPTPKPAPGPAPYLIRHGAGYTVYEHHSHALQQELRVYAAPDAPVKIMRLRLQNTAQAPRRITVICYAELVLGVDREATQATIVPTYDEAHGAILARNAYNAEFGERVTFLAANKAPIGATADRSDFLGRLGNLQRPAALRRIGLADRVQAGVDPCAALHVHVDLPAHGAEEVFFLFGQGADQASSLALIKRFCRLDVVDAAWQANKDEWEKILGAVTVETPDAAMNLLLNRWLIYQALSCRLWGRSALYQSSGAYGFRDQLQDVLAFLHVMPQIARAQILQAASHQFKEGDVLHWWHPPSGRGVRTRITDDLLWLPYVTARYVAATGDIGILEQRTPFLVGSELDSDTEERYGHYGSTEESYTILEHCRRAIERGLTAGPHGIPLMGTGDWNDGMNRVGIEGKGESIWLGWFVVATLTAFADMCDTAGIAGGDGYRKQANEVRKAVETWGWDGEWYLRAYCDDGTLLGSAQNRECRIDAIAQSWAVLSGASDPRRARRAMDAVVEHLVKEDDRLLLLFAPPLDKTHQELGYIKGYLPGIRENGGQYTHAALWSIWAFAELGDTDRTQYLFQLINPILCSDTPAKAARYKVEPYVVSADVYNVSPHVGRGGWTWYTGSAGWMVQVGIQAILGLRATASSLRFRPCIPATWPGFSVIWRHGSSEYLIQVENSTGAGRGVGQITLDGEPCMGDEIPLQDDGRQHHVSVRLGDVEKIRRKDLSSA